MTARRSLPLIAAVALALTAVVAVPERGSANGVPILVDLAYIDGLSNWGPTDADGTVELSFAEGYARLDAAGLPRLDTERYQGWIVNSESNDAISIGSFNADGGGVISFEGDVPALSDFGFDLFIITVEPSPDDAPQPTSDRSIGGRFTLLGAVPGDDGTPGDVQASPGELPNTGDPTLLHRHGSLRAVARRDRRLARARPATREATRMIRGLYTAASGLVLGLRRQEVVADNLANVETPGYKGETSAAASFETVLAHRVGNAPVPVPLTFVQRLGTVGTGAYQDAREVDMGAGTLNTTGRELDLGLAGPGFFAVQTPDGTRYTRDGRFEATGEGILVTGDGDPVLSVEGQPINVAGVQVVIVGSGEVFVDGESRGTLQVVELDPSRIIRARGTQFEIAIPPGRSRLRPVRAPLCGRRCSRNRTSTSPARRRA